MNPRPHRPERDLESRRDLLVRQIRPGEEKQCLSVTSVETNDGFDKACPQEDLGLRMAVRARHIRLTFDHRVGANPALFSTAMVADHIVCDAEQPGSSVSCWIHALGTAQGLRERLGRDVDRGVASDTAHREAVDRIEVIYE
jgi:hypothetical protein